MNIFIAILQAAHAPDLPPIADTVSWLNGFVGEMPAGEPDARKRREYRVAVRDQHAAYLEKRNYAHLLHGINRRSFWKYPSAIEKKLCDSSR